MYARVRVNTCECVYLCMCVLVCVCVCVYVCVCYSWTANCQGKVSSLWITNTRRKLNIIITETDMKKKYMKETYTYNINRKMKWPIKLNEESVIRQDQWTNIYCKKATGLETQRSQTTFFRENLQCRSTHFMIHEFLLFCIFPPLPPSSSFSLLLLPHPILHILFLTSYFLLRYPFPSPGPRNGKQILLFIITNRDHQVDNGITRGNQLLGAQSVNTLPYLGTYKLH